MSATPTTASDAPSPAVNTTAPALSRRMAAFVYEGVLLFGVVMIAGYLYSSLTQMHHALKGTLGLQAFLFIVLGIYFTWFWSRGGQTVAMKAWHIKLLDAHGRPVSQARAAMRYLLCWLWFAPALLAAHLSGLKSGASIFGILFAGVAAYAALTRLNPQRQFWHDVVCGTRLVDARSVKTTAA
ncbi:MAG TPA: RDD family protein [Ideonella sp.]|uniref:RDD family protein n=1 Tax=Ideonella sp. TaxID=1929293 RepID=UPI002E30BBD3|nr:RDD family protein [Ideonella sp.]HEX5684395.1 RDD family protein [Ideonella sp.]